QRRLPNEPHLVRLREHLLDTALGFCERFRQGSDSPAVVLQAARTWRLVGDIREALGQHTRAADAYASSARLYGELLATNPARPTHRAELGDSPHPRRGAAGAGPGRAGRPCPG